MSTNTARTDPDVREDVVLYVIPGSHSCRAAMLMLAHKRIGYRRVTLPTGAHPVLLRALGFAGNREPIRSVDGATNRSLATFDRLGTVPALRFGGERVQRSRVIARFLDGVRPQPPLFPVDAERRSAVEAAEQWGDETFQMAARRLALTGASHGLDTLHQRANAAGSERCSPSARRCVGSTARSRRDSCSEPTRRPSGRCSPSCRRCSIGSTRGSPTVCSTHRS
jgi:glutathione S-transferase